MRSAGEEEKVENGVYRHFKGGVYEVIGEATHSETGERMVVYRPLQGGERLWVRPSAMWRELVEREGTRQPRFQRIERDRVPTGEAVARSEDDSRGARDDDASLGASG